MTVISDEVVYTNRSGTLYDVLELILDRGIVIDAFVRISLVGIEIIKIDARVVVASVDTYLRFAEVCNRLDLENTGNSRTVPELLGGGGMAGSAAKSVGKTGAKKVAKSAGEKIRGLLEGQDEDEREPVGHSAAGRHGNGSHVNGNGHRPHSRRHAEGD
jgi:hypothetical protein